MLHCHCKFIHCLLFALLVTPKLTELKNDEANKAIAKEARSARSAGAIKTPLFHTLTLSTIAIWTLL